jgi:hypothetical protein
VAHPPGNFFLIMSMPWLSISWCGTEPFGASLPMIFLFPACRLAEEGPPTDCRSVLQVLRQRGAAGL